MVWIGAADTRCRCPACWRCRRTYIQQQQRAAIAWVDGLHNADLAFVSVVATGCTDLNNLGAAIAGRPRHARTRVPEARVPPDRAGLPDTKALGRLPQRRSRFEGFDDTLAQNDLQS